MSTSQSHPNAPTPSGDGEWRKDRSGQHLRAESPAAPALLALLVFGVLAGISAWLCRVELSRQRADLLEDTELIAPVAAERFQTLVQDELRSLRRIVRGVAAGNITNTEQLAKSIEHAHATFPIVVWVNPAGIVQAVAAKEGYTTDIVAGDSITNWPMWGEVYQKSRKPYRDAIIAGELNGRPAQWLCLPYIAPPRDGKRERGAVLAMADFGRRAGKSFANGPWKSWSLMISDEQGYTIYSTDPKRRVGSMSVSQPLTVMWSKWQMQVCPTALFASARKRPAPWIVLGGGLATATLAGLGAWQALNHRRRERARTAAHLAALEALAHMSQNISESPGDSQAPLAQMAEVAARLTDMPMRIVALVDRLAGSLRIIHRQGITSSDNRMAYPLSETPLSRQSMSTGRPLMIGDVEKDPPGSLHLMRAYGVRACIVLPLLAGGDATGVILLASPRPRRFSVLDHRLADLWVAEASALLSNRRLYERMEQAVTSLRRLLDQRDTLYQVNATIQHADSLREALDRLAELAPRALEVDAAVVVLAHCDPQLIQIASVTRTDPPNAMPVDAVVECSTCASVIRSGQIKILEDTAELPIRGFPDMGSALFVPLRGSGVTNGLLVLLRRQKGPFHPEQVQSAELFAARAAAAIESARLHEQTRRQADTNAILLRELNHRVGNNLASIVGLLSMGADRLPAQSRQWLDRAIERVAMMARAHELFSGGVQEVQLGELVRTTLASVSPVKGPDIRICVELEQGDLKLPATRGITLAMVLHELAYNAVVHALAEGGGDLVVRGRQVSDDRIAIEIIDRAAVAVAADGSAPEFGSRLDLSAAAAGDGNGNGQKQAGIGLQIVRNLVSRELRGSFTLSRSPDGGTVATVEIPLGGDS